MQKTTSPFRYYALAGTVLGAALLPMAASATDLSEVFEASGITATGHAEASFTHGFNQGPTLAYRAFDSQSDSFTFNQALLNLGYQPTKGFGAFVTVLAGNDAQGVNGSYGDGGGKFALGQAFVQYANGPITVIAGRFWTLAGLEVVDSALDANASRSLLFQLAEPFAHTGIRASYKIGDSVTTYLGVSNSATGGRATDDNKQKTLEFGASYAPSSSTTLALYEYYGFEGAGPSVRTNYLDAIAIFQLSEPLSLSFNADWYRASGNGVDIYAAGIGTWLGYQFAPQWKATLRGEYLSTKNVVACPKSSGKCDLEEATVTVDYQAYKSKSGLSAFDILAEFRYDVSGNRVFPDPNLNGPGSADNQADVAVKVIYKF